MNNINSMMESGVGQAPFFNFGADEILTFAENRGILDIPYLQDQMKQMSDNEFLNKHPYSIWKGKDGLWRTYLPDDKSGRIMKKRRTQKEIKDIVISFWKEKEENPTFSEEFHKWNDRKLALKKIVQSTHMKNEQIFNRHYYDFGKRKMKYLKPEELVDFLEEQIAKYDLTAKAFSNLKVITKGTLKTAKRDKIISFNYTDVFSELEISDKEFREVIKEDYQEVYDDKEMNTMIVYLEDNLDMLNLGILLIFVTGIRVGELVTLKHADFEGNTFKIRRCETRYKLDGRYVYEVTDFPKTKAGVRTAIIPTAYNWIVGRLQTLNPQGEFIFENNGRRVSTNSIRRRLDTNCKRLGIYHKSPHKIRKTYGTILLDNGVDNNLIIGQMGHTNIACTEKYYHRNRKDLQKKTEIISSLDEFSSDKNNMSLKVINE